VVILAKVNVGFVYRALKIAEEVANMAAAREYVSKLVYHVNTNVYGNANILNVLKCAVKRVIDRVATNHVRNC
jgi:hypothetical protein